jgi:hypothetical protein
MLLRSCSSLRGFSLLKSRAIAFGARNNRRRSKKNVRERVTALCGVILLTGTTCNREDEVFIL